MSFCSSVPKKFCEFQRFPRENNLPILSFCLTSTSLRQPHCELCIMNYALISRFPRENSLSFCSSVQKNFCEFQRFRRENNLPILSNINLTASAPL